MNNALEIVQNLDNVQTIMMTKQIYQDIFKAVPLNEVKQMVKDDESVALLNKLDTNMMKQYIDSKQSVDIARNMLLAFANDRDLSCLVINAWEEVKADDALMNETILALGLIANLTLFMATTELEFECKGVKVKKGRASADQIKAVLSPVAEFVKNILHGIM